MDSQTKEKQLEITRKRSTIARKTNNMSSFDIDFCISQFHIKIKQGPYYICTICNRMLYKKTVLNFKKDKYVNCNVENVFTHKLSFDNKEYICKTCHSKVIKGKIPCQTVCNNIPEGGTPFRSG